MKRLLPFVLSALSVSAFATSADDCKNYPHWHNCSSAEPLMQIEKIIAAHANDKIKPVFAFDWDGTLYNEKIPQKANAKDKRSGQSTWRRWAAEQIEKHNAQNYFPMLKPAGKQKAMQKLWADNVRFGDDMVEGKLPYPVQETDVEKFTTIATMPAGMTPAEYMRGVDRYLQDYSVEANAYRPVFDVYQRLQSAGFKPWIITGSNPYFVATALHRVNTDLGYKVMPACSRYVSDVLRHPKTFKQEAFRANCHIAGNAAKVRPNGRFCSLYDTRFVLGKETAIVNNDGKWLAAQYIQRHTGPIFFYAGNSDGDAAMIRHLLTGQTHQKNVAALLVNPVGKELDKIRANECQKAACITVMTNT